MLTGPGNALMTGAVLSSTVIVCAAVAVLPQASVAVHVLVMENSPAQRPGVVTSAKLKLAVLQASLAVGVLNTGVTVHSIVMLAPTPLITGAVLSSTVIVCAAVAVLPQASVAVHVLVMEYSPAQRPGVVTSAKLKLAVPQASLAVGVLNTGVTVHSIVMLAPTPLMTGAVLSSTVIVCAAVAVLPQASVAVHVLVMENSPAQRPGVFTSLNVIVVVPQASLAVGVLNTGVTVHSIVMLAPTPEMTGAVLSSTVIVCAAVAVLPQASVAVHVLVMENSPAQRPGVVTSAKFKLVVPQASLAVGEEKTGVAVHSIVMLAPTPLMTGAVLSSTVIVCAAVAVLPQASVAVHVLVMEYSPAQVPGVVTSAKLKLTVPHASLAVGEENVSGSLH